MAKDNKTIKDFSDDLLIEEMIRRVDEGEIILSTNDFTKKEGIVMFHLPGDTSGRFVIVLDVEENE